MITLAAPNTLEVEVKRSRFIAAAARADSPEEALAWRAEVQQAEANHNCWAYRIGGLYRFSDDGEPGGTAGRPILAAIEGQGLDHVMVVVTRWFGGIKLGAGGLVRAYGGTAAECLRVAERLEVLPRATVVVAIPFDAVHPVYPLLETFETERAPERYTAQGAELEVTLLASRVADFERALTNATRGRATLRVLSEDAPEP